MKTFNHQDALNELFDLFCAKKLTLQELDTACDMLAYTLRDDV